MGFRKFGIWIIKNLIILLVATLIFSSITLDLPELIKGVFGDIFAYASPEVQKQVINQLAGTCSSLEQGQSLVSMSQVCANASLLDSMKEDCASYRELKRRNIKVENEQQVKETCQQVESGEIESTCDEIRQKGSLLPDFSKIGALCKDYKDGLINDKEFFFNIIGGAIPSQMQMPNIGILERYNSTINYLNRNKIIYFVILAILMAGLYSLIRDSKAFLAVLSGILLSLGLLIMLPYFAILAYGKFIGIDTTSLLSGILGEGFGIDPKAVISMILLLFLRTYNAFIITIGIVFLAVGIFGKTYEKLFMGKPKQAAKKKDKKMEKLVGELKDSMKKKKKS